MSDGEPAVGYSGNESYRYVERAIDEAGELLIVSPYIDMYYAKFIAQRSKGKKIRIISSSMESAAKMEIGGSRRLKGLFYFIFLLFFANLASYLIHINMVLVEAASALLLAVAVPIGAKKKGAAAEIKHPKKFVHAKMYISDALAIVGSANLTYRGMHSNIEHLEIITDREKIDELRRIFYKMWDET